MKALMIRLSMAAFIVCLGFGTPTHAHAARSPWLSTTPYPIPADQDFEAVFHVAANSGSIGFWGQQYPLSEINGNVITIFFDMGCGFPCSDAELYYGPHPFTMRALPAGTYVIRFSAGGDPSSEPLAEFTIHVGMGHVGPVPLPIGLPTSALLGLLLLLLGWLRLRMIRAY